jgi:hypothetical protein
MDDTALKDLCVPAMSTELHHLAQGKGGATVGNNAIFYLTNAEIKCIPKDQTVTYARMIIDHRPPKHDPNWVWITVSGNFINYPYEFIKCTADMVSAKKGNSVICTQGQKHVPKHTSRSIQVHANFFQAFSRWHNWPLQSAGERPQWLCNHGYLTRHICFTTSCILEKKLLWQRLGWHGYFKVQHTPGLCKHVSHTIWFNLCNDDFGVKYIGDENLKQFFAALCTETYDIVEDWAGDLYCSINLEWNFVKRWVYIPMPIIAIKNLTIYNHPPPLKPQHCPHTPNPIAYWKYNQAMTLSNTSPLLNAAWKKHIQYFVGSFLYYSCAGSPTILMVLSAIIAKQSASNEKNLAHLNRFLDYIWMHPNAKNQL